ncbi:hypothetical protein ACOBR2_08315 [Telmatobacter bradus]|uniref:hypothetical protein n=1 Tax=Telmatobacter bradus TaxID=474953 RepID=UPI003B43D3BA
MKDLPQGEREAKNRKAILKGKSVHGGQLSESLPCLVNADLLVKEGLWGGLKEKKSVL